MRGSRSARPSRTAAATPCVSPRAQPGQHVTSRGQHVIRRSHCREGGSRVGEEEEEEEEKGDAGEEERTGGIVREEEEGAGGRGEEEGEVMGGGGRGR
eukprot:1304462-Rhodomonas_salina.1